MRRDRHSPGAAPGSTSEGLSAAPSRHRWRREGLVLAPPAQHAWWCSHAQAPTILALNERLWRVYFGARERTPRTRILCADLDPGDGFRVLRLHDTPVIELGAAGAFDADGMGPSTAMRRDGRVFLYYTGIIRREDVPYEVAIGLAVSDDDGLTFRREIDAPILGRGSNDPWFATMPCVRSSPAGFQMDYASGTGWRHVGDRLEPFYALRRSSSDDGRHWRASEQTLACGQDDDAGLTRPWVLVRDGARHLWYSRRGASRFREPGPSSYRIRHAVAGADGRSWQDDGEMAFAAPPEPSDWDGWMQAYACVHPWRDDLIMLYNGNDFGRGGFGVARLSNGAAEEGRA